MSCLKGGFSVYGTFEATMRNRASGSFRACSFVGTLQFKESKSNDFWRGNIRNFNTKAPTHDPINTQVPGLRWWEKSLKPNMLEIHSAQELVDYLLIVGDTLVIVHFYSPGCGGCKALHPKICELAELNPNSTFLSVNYEQHKVMCHALHVHVLPFFRFYRGAEGRLCSFSCTNATIKKFKDTLAKHGTDRCSLGPAKGLNDSELLALDSSGLISRMPNSAESDNKMEDIILWFSD